MARINKIASDGMIIPMTEIGDVINSNLGSMPRFTMDKITDDVYQLVLQKPESEIPKPNPVDWAKRAQATICSYINHLGGGKIELHFHDIDKIVSYTDFARRQNPESIIFRAGKKLEKKMKSMYQMNLRANGEDIRMEYLIDHYGVSVYQGCD